MSVFVYGFGDPVQLLHGWWVKGDFIFEMALALPIEVRSTERLFC